VSRPEVSVVMPFGGQPGQLPVALAALRALDTGPRDELLLADNAGVAAGGLGPGDAGELGLIVVPAAGERSPARARNAGAVRASKDWILFLDSDCRPQSGLLEAYFAREIPGDVGALAGEVVPGADDRTMASRYGSARNFLSQQAHIRHPYMPRAAAANLLVRRAAFEQLGGFYEGLRAAEDTDFAWRLQRAGWRLELCSAAAVEHQYRASVGELRRQWRSYAAGRAWLARRYEGFEPEPAAARALKRLRNLAKRDAAATSAGAAGSHRDAAFRGLDVLLGLEELAGLILPNRPAGSDLSDHPAPEVVLVVDDFPRLQDPLVELAASIGRARIEAVARPEAPDLEAARRLTISYLEDEGAATKAAAALTLLVRHPLRVATDMARRGPRDPATWDLAPAVRRLERDPQARLHPLGGPAAQALARRLAHLAGRPLER
jgi:hypothetical protein